MVALGSDVQKYVKKYRLSFGFPLFVAASASTDIRGRDGSVADDIGDGDLGDKRLINNKITDGVI